MKYSLFCLIHSRHFSLALVSWAKSTMIGRAYLHGLGAMGEAGVTRCLEIIRKELDITMAFCGKTDIRQVDRSILLPRRP